MKPEYEGYRGKRDEPKDVISARVPVWLKVKGEQAAVVDGDSLSGLMIEGLVRVIEDREQDPQFRENLKTALEERRVSLEAQLAETRDLICSLENPLKST